MATKEELVKLCQGNWFDEDLKAIAEHKKISRDTFLFIFSLQHLVCSGKHPKGGESKTLRAAAWGLLDLNGNGWVSLAETGRFLEIHLINYYAGSNKQLGVDKDEAKRLYKHFYPCFIRAFNDAADYGNDSKKIKQKSDSTYKNQYTTSATADDYVEFKEFRLLLTYLCIYATIYSAFADIDGGGKGVDKTDDRRISFEEWAQNKKLLKGHPLKSLSISANQDPTKVFKRMDSDDKGMVLLSEFSMYIEDYEFGLKTRWGSLLNAGEPAPKSGAAKLGAKAEAAGKAE